MSESERINEAIKQARRNVVIETHVGEVAYERLGRSERSMTLVSTKELDIFRDGPTIFSLHSNPIRLWKVLMHAQDRLIPEKMCYIEVYVTDRDVAAYHDIMARYHAEQKAAQGSTADYFHNQGYAGI